MTALRDLHHADACAAVLAGPDDLSGWREQARRLIMAAVPPGQVVWEVPGEGTGDLFAGAAGQAGRLPAAAAGAAPPRVPRGFFELAAKAALHSDPRRFSLLYRLLWRLQTKPRLLEDAADDDVRKLHDLARAVRRDIHKMRAFVRFRAVEQEDGGGEHFVAWFEPSHHILRANAAFFVNRFTAMQWSILTPAGSLHWDGDVLREGPPARREDAPGDDPTEDLWRTYYASIFNPARLKIGAMLKEMPRRYWKNMPETALIPGLIAGAQAREAAMVAQGASLFTQGRPASLAAIAEGIAACRRCEIGCTGTRAVAGEGPPRAPLMIIGEQPGDSEELAGQPFVGPAGQLLRAQLGAAGIDPAASYVTNAVKHFKFTMRGKRRLHQNPSAKEIDLCRWWVEGERELVRPKLVLALGASAARSVLGRTVSVQQVRGQAMVLENGPLEDGAELWITTHPSYLLRLEDQPRAIEEARFAADLRAVAARLAQLAG